MDNDKWVWADEEEVRPQAIPRFEEKLTPIVEWADVEPPPAAPVIPQEPLAQEPVAPQAPAVSPLEVSQQKAPGHPTVAGSGREISASVVKAIVLHLEGNIEGAILELQAGLRIGERPVEIYTAIGALQMELERFEEAAASYREVLKRDASHEIARHNLATCEEKLKEAAKKPSPSVVKAIVLHMERKFEEGVKELQRGIKAGEQAVDVYSALGHLQFELGRFDAAAEAYAQVLKREPLHTTCHYNLAVSLEKLGRHKDALSSFQKAFEINSQRVEMGIGIGVSLLHLRRFAEAVTAFEDCLESHPGDATALFGRAFALQSAARLPEAEAAYLEALTREPAQEEALVNLIALSISQGNDAGLREYCARLLSILPQSRVALEALMTADLAGGNYEAARSRGEELTRIAADSFEVWFNYGVACHGLNRTEDAAAAFAKATRIRPKSAEAFSSLGQALQKKGDLAGAKSAYDSALKLSPDDAALLWNLVLIAEQSGAPADAEKYCTMLASKAPKSGAVQFRLGSLRFQQSDYTGSADAFRGCLKTKPSWPAAQLNLGLALWKSGNRDEAQKSLETISAAPYSNDAWRHLAAMAVEREDYSVALNFYQRLAEAGERSQELFYNTGLALQNLGRPEEAVGQYRAALAVNPELNEATYALLQLSKVTARADESQEDAGKVPVPRLLKRG